MLKIPLSYNGCMKELSGQDIALHMSRLLITYDPLVPSEVSELQVAGAVYSTDFRATGEALDYDIPAMWKYENLAPWLCANTHSKYLVNEGSSDLSYNGLSSHSQILSIKKGEHASESIYSRFKKRFAGKVDILSLWVGVPHPDADNLARELNIPINYKYGSFLVLNDKISQKKLIPTHLTPDWTELHSVEDMPSDADGYVKNRIGAGGFGITRVRPSVDNGNPGELIKNTFYFEKYINGAPSSIQCHKNGKSVTVFGYSTQTITDGQYYTGSIIHSISDLVVSDRKPLEEIIQALSPLMDSYDGFFGIDYIKADRGVYFLEANIRMTAVTIPTLLFNITDRNTACFTEDADSEVSGDVVLTKNSAENTRDILRFDM